MRHCPRVRSLLTSDDFGEGFTAVSRMRCKQWDCPYCSTKNADIWRAHLLHTFCEVMTSHHWVFITLTAPSWAHKNPIHSLKKMKVGWSKIYDKLRYRYGRGFSFVMVYETHKSGAFHIHVLIDLGLEYDALGAAPPVMENKYHQILAERRHKFCKDLKKMAVKSKIGYIVHARRILEGESGIDNARLAVGYVTKYFLKQRDLVGFPKRMRRIGTSRDIGSPKTKAKSEAHWQVRSYLGSDEVGHNTHFLIQEKRFLGAVDFDETKMYPGDE